jgi:hypothetical protein
MAGFCKHGNELSRFIKDMQVLDQLSNYKLLQKHYTALSELIIGK